MPINALGQFIITDDAKKRTTGRFYRRPSPERLAAERRQMKYDARSNRCPKCYMTRALDGSCDCS